MNLTPYAARAAQLLRKGAKVRSWHAAEDRSRGIATIERALARGQRRQAWRTATFAAAGLAAGIAGLWFGTQQSHGTEAVVHPSIRLFGSATGAGAMVSDGSGTRPLGTSSQLSAGSRVVANDHGGAALRLSTGTLLNLDGNASFSVTGTGALQRFKLQFGGVFAKVAKLKPGERFVVDTPDAAVEVRGTAFKLTVLPKPEACGHGARTRLRVTEGLVTVYHSGVTSQVAAGESWPADCFAEDTQPPTASSLANPAHGEPAPAIGGTAKHDDHASTRIANSAPVKPSPHTGSSLEAQNDLFARAVRARTSGDQQLALTLYARFQANYPKSPLAQNASVERMRLLRGGNLEAARSEARRYLRSYPGGFAAAEAQQLLSEP